MQHIWSACASASDLVINQIPISSTHHQSPPTWQTHSHLPNLLPLTPLLDTVGHAVDAVLQAIRQAHDAVAYRLRAGAVVDGMAYASPGCSYYASCGARDTADYSADLDSKELENVLPWPACFRRLIEKLTVPVTPVRTPDTPLLLLSRGMLEPSRSWMDFRL